jgi:hypothetical protein
MGFVVVPMLFAYLPSAAIAGNMAGRLFSLQSWISAGCCLLLLLAVRSNRQEQLRALAPALSLLALAGVLLALLLEFAVTPHIVARENLALWHRVGTGMYFVQWLCALWAFGKLSLLPLRTI